MSEEELALIENLLYVFETYAREYREAPDAENAVNRCINHITAYRRGAELAGMNPGENPWDLDDEEAA